MTRARTALMLAFGIAVVVGCGSDGRRTTPGFDTGPMRLDGSSPGFDAGPRPDSGSPGFDSGSPGFDSGSPGFDSGLPRDAGGVPSFDSGIPSFDGGIPSFDGAIGGMCTMDSDCAPGEMCCELIPGISLCLASCMGFP